MEEEEVVVGGACQTLPPPKYLSHFSAVKSSAIQYDSRMAGTASSCHGDDRYGGGYARSVVGKGEGGVGAVQSGQEGQRSGVVLLRYLRHLGTQGC